MKPYYVLAKAPMDAVWQARQEALLSAAGRRADDHTSNGKTCTYGWEVETFDQAHALKERLRTVERVAVVVRQRQERPVPSPIGGIGA